MAVSADQPPTRYQAFTAPLATMAATAITPSVEKRSVARAARPRQASADRARPTNQTSGTRAPSQAPAASRWTTSTAGCSHRPEAALSTAWPAPASVDFLAAPVFGHAGTVLALTIVVSGAALTDIELRELGGLLLDETRVRTQGLDEPPVHR